MANRQKQFIDFEKKYKYKLDDVDVAHELVFRRAKALLHSVARFNETVKQAEWIEKHRPEIKKLEMSNGEVLKGEQAENTWSAFYESDWTCISSAVMTSRLLEDFLEEAGFYGK